MSYRYKWPRMMLLIASIVVFSYRVCAQTVNVPVGNTVPTATPVTIPAAYSTATGNYVRTYEVRMITTDPVAVTAAGTTIKQVKQTTAYADGLGRTLQTVEKSVSPAGYDLVTPAVYDSYGREPCKYLPYVQTGSGDGAFKQDPFNSQKTFYSNTSLNPGLVGEKVYYSETQFEASPLNRVLKTFAPGNSWASTGGNHAKQSQYLVNTAADGVRIWTMPATGVIPTSTATYPAGTLTKTVSIDEQGITVVTFVDKEQHTILKKVSLSSIADGHSGWLCTYYVYDDIGNLRFVVPPKVIPAISTNWIISQSLADELCFQYTYDARNRMVIKKLPGAGPVQMVYDTRDRLVFSQDVNLLGQGQWLVTFYDYLNRPVMTALYPSTQTAAQLQTLLNNAVASTTTLTNTFPGTTDLVIGNRVTGQSLYQASQTVTFQDGFVSEANAEFTAQIDPALQGNTETVVVSNPLPGITGYQPLTYTYYDNYNYPGAKSLQGGELSKLQADATNAAYAEPVSTNSAQTAGLTTGVKERVLGTDQWLASTTFYDPKGRVIQTVSDNLQGGLVVNSSLYDFSGKLLSAFQHITNMRSGLTPDEQILTINTYDDADRITKITKKLNGDAPKLLSQTSYDELGRVKKTILGNNMEVINNEYNVAGSLTSVNKDYLAGTNSEINHFGEQLSYDLGFTQPQYNGNIAGTIWKGFNTPLARAYGFSYDPTGRLKQADFRQQNEGTTNYTNDKVDYTVNTLAYDENGNILTMNQNGLKAGKIAAVDQLHYNVPVGSNKLQYVWDGVSAPTSTLGDFKETAANATANQSGTPDYSYDSNGNLTKDDNKGIATISYNHLNLPQLITITGKGTIQYVYGAGGGRLRKIVTDNTIAPAQVTTTDYVNGLVYQNDTLQFIPHEQGRARLVAKTGATPVFAFDYMLKDHLGNVREVLTEKSDTSVYTATMELAVGAKENALFSNVDVTRATVPAGYPSDNLTNPDAYVAALNAATGKKVGPSLVLRVMAGDTLQTAVSAFYKSTDVINRNNFGTQMVAALVQAFSAGTTADGPHVGTGSSSPISVSLDTTMYNNLVKSDPNWANNPKAYLNYVFFDDQFNLENISGVKQVPATPNVLAQLASGALVVPKTGFAYIYVSNESGQEVDFNNLVVTHKTGPLLEETHYYPYGLTMAEISSHALGKQENRYKYNGIELDTALGLNEYEAELRDLDPQTGRWWQMDPMGEDKDHDMDRWSPYVSNRDNPILYKDPKGDCPNCLFGAVTGLVVDLTVQISTAIIKTKLERKEVTLSSIFDQINFTEVGAATAAGAITSGLSAVEEAGLSLTTKTVLANASFSVAKQLGTGDGTVNPVDVMIDAVPIPEGKTRHLINPGNAEQTLKKAENSLAASTSAAPARKLTAVDNAANDLKNVNNTNKFYNSYLEGVKGGAITTATTEAKNADWSRREVKLPSIKQLSTPVDNTSLRIKHPD